MSGVVEDDMIVANLSDLNELSGFVYVSDSESQGDYDPTNRHVDGRQPVERRYRDPHG